MSHKSSFTIVIPCYNESSAIERFWDECISFLPLFGSHFPSWSLQFYFVDNNSTDGSKEHLERLIQNAPKELATYFKTGQCSEQGYGAALKYGFNQTSATFIGFADLDNTYPLYSFIPMLKIIEKSSADMVMASRLQPGSEMTWLRRIGNIFYLKWTNWLFDSALSDTCSGMRVFHSSQLPQILNLKRNDLSFSIQFTAWALKNNWIISEYPIFYRDRIGRSKLSVLKDGITFFIVLNLMKFRKHASSI